MQVLILCCSSFQLLLEHQKALEDHMQLRLVYLFAIISQDIIGIVLQDFLFTSYKLLPILTIFIQHLSLPESCYYITISQGGYSLPFYMGVPCQYLGSEILQQNHIWGL